MTHAPPAAPTVCLSMIVKNEAQVLARCLASVRPLLSSWVIVDTGSTDDTENVARASLAGLSGQFVRRPWVDFATNRTEAFELSRQRADYSLTIDADDEAEILPSFRAADLWHDIYHVRAYRQGIQFPMVCLLRSTVPWRYEGVVHETPTTDVPVTRAVLESVVYRMHHMEGARSRDPDKYLRDAEALERALLHEPDNARTVYYLAQSYRDHGDRLRALAQYRRRIAMGGDPDEVWVSLYNVARLLGLTGASSDEVVAAHLAAHACRPLRAETLYNLTVWLRAKGESGLAHAFAAAAIAIPLPRADMHRVDEEIYRWRALEQYALACRDVGLLEEARQADERLISETCAPGDALAKAQARLGWATSDPSNAMCSPWTRRLRAAGRCRGDLEG